MNITKYLGTSFLSAALILASGISCLAKNSESVTFSHNVVVNGKTLPAGHYTVQWETHSPQATVVFTQHRKVVLTTEGKMLTRKGNYRNATLEREDAASDTANVYNPGQVVYNIASDGSMSVLEIRFAGSNRILVFNE